MLEKEENKIFEVDRYTVYRPFGNEFVVFDQYMKKHIFNEPDYNTAKKLSKSLNLDFSLYNYLLIDYFNSI